MPSSQSHHSGIESDGQAEKEQGHVRLNRTIPELKDKYREGEIYQVRLSQSHHTGIERNGNQLFVSGAVGLNRTIPELKGIIMRWQPYSLQRLNRTIPELKGWSSGKFQAGCQCLNRTIPELKVCYNFHTRNAVYVSIAP